MSTLDHQRWTIIYRQRRWDVWKKLLAVPWAGDRNWDGRTIGLHLPLALRNRAVVVQEKLRMKSMKEVLFRCIEIGLIELEEMPPPKAIPQEQIADARKARVVPVKMVPFDQGTRTYKEEKALMAEDERARGDVGTCT